MRSRRVLVCTLLALGPLLAQEQRPAFIRMHPLLRALDTNQDAVISSEELRQAPKVLASLDANKDGVITRDELRPAGFRPEGRRGSEGESAPPAASDLVSRLMSFDANGDGKLTKSEVPDRMQGLFDRADTDKDGVLNQSELTKLAEAQQQQAGSGGGDFRGRDRSGAGGVGGPGGQGEEGRRGPGGTRIDPV